MKIAYRRMSGPIGLSSLEQGTRGMWLEKRLALILTLRRRGHQVDIVNRMTKFSLQLDPPTFDDSYDLLFIEFGSSNEVFYGDDLRTTREYADRHRGQIVFLCDDPDLPYLWKTVESPSRWSVWMNAARPAAFGGQPEGVATFDFPFAALLPIREVEEKVSGPAVYVGRPKGRENVVRALLRDGVPFVVHGRESEWKGFGVQVQPVPTQAQRGDFYSQSLASVVLADRKHHRLGWRTGRAYHALCAGCPAIVESAHEALVETFDSFRDAQELSKRLADWKDARVRRRAWKSQVKRARNDADVAEATFRVHGL